MIPETYLEYLSLISILKRFDPLDIANDNFVYNPIICKSINLGNIIDRVTELEKDILKEYICTE